MQINYSGVDLVTLPPSVYDPQYWAVRLQDNWGWKGPQEVKVAFFLLLFFKFV